MAQRNKLDLNIILETASEIADKEGITKVTLASLAEKLEIRTPSLYNHLDGLPGLRKKLAIYGLDKLNYDLTNSAVGKSGDDAIRAVSEAYINFARLHPGLYEATFLAPDIKEPDMEKSSKQIVDLCVKILGYYNLKNEEAIHITRGLRSILHGFASIEQKGGFGLALDTDESFNIIINTFISGIHVINNR